MITILFNFIAGLLLTALLTAALFGLIFLVLLVLYR